MKLSTREFEITERICLGATKKEVATDINRSLYTVETTIKNVYEKLGINKLSDLVLWYCGIMFNIAEDIKERQKEILSIAILIFSSYAISPGAEDMRTRSTRTQRTCAAEITSNRLRTRRRERDIPLDIDILNTIAV